MAMLISSRAGWLMVDIKPIYLKIFIIKTKFLFILCNIRNNLKINQYAKKVNLYNKKQLLDSVIKL